jgi:hypothetical protein
MMDVRVGPKTEHITGVAGGVRALPSRAAGGGLWYPVAVQVVVSANGCGSDGLETGVRAVVCGDR